MSGNLTPDTANALLNAAQTQSAASAQKLADAKTLAKIEETAKEFEAVFISAMMKPMFEGIKSDGAFKGGKGEEIFQGMMIQEYGKLMSRNGAVGIADSVKKQLIEIQGLQVEPAATTQTTGTLPPAINTSTTSKATETQATPHMDELAKHLNDMIIGE